MNKLLFAAAALALAAGSSPVSAQNMQVLTYHVVAKGRTVALQSWTCWFPDRCVYAPCHMKTAQEPTLGRIKPVIHAATIPSNGGACAGKPTTALDVIYTPRPGAHGGDFFVLETHSDNGLSHRIEITVDVP